MKICGIDWSMSAPSITVYDTNLTFNFTNCESYYLTNKKKYIINNDELKIYSNNVDDITKNYQSNEERWDKLSDWGIDIIKNCDYCLIEGFSFGSTSSMLCQIAENASVLKHKIYKLNKKLIIAEPTKIKKFASGKGNATKPILYQSFVEQEKIQLRDVFNMKGDVWEPMAGVIDSFYMCKYLLSSFPL